MDQLNSFRFRLENLVESIVIPVAKTENISKSKNEDEIETPIPSFIKIRARLHVEIHLIQVFRQQTVNALYECKKI